MNQPRHHTDVTVADGPTDGLVERRLLADRLQEAGDLRSPAWRAAVEAVPRELFLRHGVFLPTVDNLWRPVTPDRVEPREWLEIAYSDESLVTQLDGQLTPPQVTEPTRGFPTSSSTIPATVVSMLEALDVEDGMTVLEIGTGTGYSTALMCHRLGKDNVTTVEVDAAVSASADAALERAGFSTWTIRGDGLLGHPWRAPYDRVIATCAVRRIPYAWVRQTRPGGIILATVGSWTYGTGLAKLTVEPDGTAVGQIIGRSSFMHARSQAKGPVSGDLAARAAYADRERETELSPTALEEWMPALLAQLAAPGAELVTATEEDGARTVYLFDSDRESFAALTSQDGSWVVRQGGPVALWDLIESDVTTWDNSGRPDIDQVQLKVSDRAHSYSIATEPELRWIHTVG